MIIQYGHHGENAQRYVGHGVLLLFEGEGEAVVHGKLCIESITVCPALVGSVSVQPALLADSISTEPALLCDVEVNKCQK